MSSDQVEEKIGEYGGDFQQWIEDQKLSDREEELWLFHYWMRTETDLSSGSIVDYRKYVAQYLDDNGELDVSGDLGSHKSAAVSKYEDFLESNFLENLSKKTGDSE